VSAGEGAQKVVEGCTHRRVRAGGDGYSGPAYVEEFDGACRACIAAALAIRFAPPSTGRDLVDRLLSPISPLTALTTDEWAIAKKALELSLPAISAAQAAQTRALREALEAQCEDHAGNCCWDWCADCARGRDLKAAALTGAPRKPA